VADERAPELRAGDADRERVADRLRENLAAGRLTLDEFSQRLDAVYDARTYGELEALTHDLPQTATTPAVPSRRTPTRWSVAVMSDTKRRSRWRIADRTTAITVMGAVELDLRKAEIETPVVEITAVAVMGEVRIVVPEGVEVDLTGLAIMGAKEDRVADVPPLPGAPLIRVRAFALMGGVKVRSKREIRDSRRAIEE
jgi:Domain of unknown function (DUF1707)/Cell wall-active antibiotics response 4TMS YvqF